MTSQGSARGRFARAIREGNLFMAELAARELRGLALNDALDLVALIAEGSARTLGTRCRALARPLGGRVAAAHAG
jgi:hypothetical protein